MNNSQIRSLVLLIASSINFMILIITLNSFEGWIDNIIDYSGPAGDYLSGKKSIAENQLKTARVINEGHDNVMNVFKRNLADNINDPRNLSFDEEYRNTISELQLKHNISSESFKMIDPPPSVKKYHYSDILLEFSCDYESLTSFMKDLEAHEKLFKVKYLDMSNPVDKNKKLKPTDIKIKLELQTMMLNPEKRSGKTKGTGTGGGALKVIIK